MPCSPVYASSLYPRDLTDAEWALLAPLLPAPAQRGRPRAWPLRLLVNAPLLRPADRLCLALSPARVSAVANGLYDLPPVALAGGLAARPRGITPCSPPAGGTPRRPLGGGLEFPHRGAPARIFRAFPRLGQPQEHPLGNGLLRRGQAGKERVRFLGQRTADTAELAIRLEGQHLVSRRRSHSWNNASSISGNRPGSRPTSSRMSSIRPSSSVSPTRWAGSSHARRKSSSIHGAKEKLMS